VVLLQADVRLCKQRVLGRKGHKTLPPKESSLHVVDNFARQLEQPSPSEGFPKANIFPYDARSSSGGKGGKGSSGSSGGSTGQERIGEAVQKSKNIQLQRQRRQMEKTEEVPAEQEEQKEHAGQEEVVVAAVVEGE
jgi:hypothetical protein